MKIKNVLCFPILFASVGLGLVACSSDDSTSELLSQTPQGNYITLDVSTPSQELEDTTRGSVITTSNIADLRLTGMKYLKTSNIDATTPEQFFYNQEVTKANNWKTAYCWPGNKEKLQLFAFAPSAALATTEGGEGVTWSSATKVGTPTLSYKQPTTGAAVQDLLIASSGELNGNTGTAAALTFSHALAKVTLKLNTLAGVQGCTIKSVTFKNIVGSGTLTFDGVWTLGAASNVTVSNLNTAEAVLFMIPQTLASTASMEVTIDYGSMEKTFTRSLSGDTWTKGQGRSYTITINTRPKLPIEYVAPYNMASATTMASSNNNNVSYYWTFSNAKNAFKNGVTINSVKYHQPSLEELRSIFPHYSGGGQANVNNLNVTEDVKIGKATYSLSSTYKGNGSTIIYAIRLASSDNRFRCAYRYTAVNNSPTGKKINVRVRYIGSWGSLSINDVAKESYWNSNNSNDITREFPCSGQFAQANKNYAVSSASSAGGYGGDAFLWSSTETYVGTYGMCLTCHVGSGYSVYWIATDSGGDPCWITSAFPVRLWTDE